MGLLQVLTNVADTLFEIFKDFIKNCVYVSTIDNGFDTPTSTRTSVEIIFASFDKNDVNSLSFSDKIQPTDIKGLMRGSSISSEVTTQDTVEWNSDTYYIVDFETDPGNILYILLLRKV